MRRTLATAIVAAMAVFIATPAANAEAYRYWGYYQWDGSTWAFASAGPADTQPSDGDVEGWRFAVTDEASTKLPRAEGDFAAICGDVAAAAGNKRVAVVIDYGAPEDNDGETPPPADGSCAEVAEDASGGDVLAAVADIRVQDGLFCAIGGWPATGCGDPVDGKAPETDESPVTLQLASGQEQGPVADDAQPDSESTDADDSESTVGIVIGVAAILALGVAALLLWRRSKEAGLLDDAADDAGPDSDDDGR